MHFKLSKTTLGNHPQLLRKLTLYDIDGKGFGGPLHSFDLGCADIVSIEAWLEVVNEDTTVAVNGEVHSWWHSGAIVHAEAQVCGFWVSQQAGQQVVLTLFPYHPQWRAAGPEQAVRI